MKLGLAGTSRLAFVISAAALAQSALAQTAAAPEAVTAAPADNNAIGDVVVTATRMGATALQSTPIAVNAVTGAQIADRGIRDAQDLKAYVPSLQVSDLNGYAQLFIRGVGSNTVYIGSDPSTTINLDGVYLARPLGYFNQFLDVERVEVLRGPQGTLYGRNSVGGTVNIISRTPSDTFEGQLQVLYGTYNRYGMQGYVSGPLTESGIRASLAFDVSGHDAYRKNVSTGGDVEDNRSFGVRGQVLIPLGGNDTWTLRADYSRQAGALGGAIKLLRPDGNALDDSILGDFSKVSMNDPNRTVLKNYGFASDASFQLAPGLTLRSLTSYRGIDGSIVADADASSMAILADYVTPISQQQFSQEFTLNGHSRKLDYVLGAYYFQEVDREPQVVPILAAGISHVQQSRLYARAAAVFGQVEFHANDVISLVAGLRYTAERKHYQLGDYFTASTSTNPAIVRAAPVLSGIPGLPDPFTVDTVRRDHALTPKFGINIRPASNALVYLSATRGFKSGGFDYGANNAVDAAAGYGPEKLWSYEIGLKSDWFNRRLRVNLDAFYYDYTDLQVENFVRIGNSFGARTQNAATAHVKGVELELQGRPIAGLELFGNVAYLDARYARYDAAYVTAFGTFDAAGKRLNNAPRWSATFGGTYTQDLGNAGSAFVGVDAHVQSTVYFTPANDGVSGVTGYPEQQRDYGVLGARIGWNSADKLWKFTVSGSNLTDRQYVTGTAGYTAAIAGRPGRPREVIAQISRKF